MLEDLKEFVGLRTRQRHYFAVFQDNPSTRVVLADLFDYCHLLTTTYEPQDERAGWIFEGRRQVILRILMQLKTSPEELFGLLSGMNEEQRRAIFDSRQPAWLGEDDE